MPLSIQWFEKGSKTTEEVYEILPFLAHLIDKLCIDCTEFYPRGFRAYHVKEIPDITLENYLKRFVKYLELDEGNLINTLIYMDRFLKKTKLFVTHNTIYGILAALFLIEHKFFNDDFYGNKYIADVAGFSIETLNTLEVQMLYDIEFDLIIKPEKYSKYHKKVARNAIGWAMVQSKEAGLSHLDTGFESKQDPSQSTYSPRFHNGSQQEKKLEDTSQLQSTL